MVITGLINAQIAPSAEPAYFALKSFLAKERSILFSGDLGNLARPLIRDPQPPMNADFVVIESTYGDRIHGERPDYIGQLTEIFQETFDKGGNVVIPSFAVGRTQEIVYGINANREKFLETKDKSYWWNMIQLLPTSYNQKRTITMNYENVFTIIRQRTGHKLDEWNTFIDIMTNELPYIKELL